MQTWTNKFHLNREGKPFPPGPWNQEVDKAVWIDPRSDLDCMIHRNPMGALCGYVGVGPDHPWHGKNYTDHFQLLKIDGTWKIMSKIFSEL